MKKPPNMIVSQIHIRVFFASCRSDAACANTTKRLEVKSQKVFAAPIKVFVCTASADHDGP